MKKQLPSVSSEETLSSSSMPVPHLPAAPIGESADAKKPRDVRTVPRPRAACF